MLRHVVSIVRSGQLRFRLETYGLYYPATPDSRPYWKVSPRALLLLLRSAREYSSWVKTTSFVRVGPHEWWARQWPGVDVEGELSRQSAEEVTGIGRRSDPPGAALPGEDVR